MANVQDDFSSDKFEQFDAEPLDGGVSSVLYYGLMDATNTTPLDPTLVYCDSAHSYHDTGKVDEIGAELETVRSYPNDPFRYLGK